MNIQSAKIKNKLDSTEPSSIIVILSSGVQMSIPFDISNSDYQEYLKWVAEGNTPAPPDEPESP
jgi:hypothetical protein